MIRLITCGYDFPVVVVSAVHPRRAAYFLAKGTMLAGRKCRITPEKY